MPQPFRPTEAALPLLVAALLLLLTILLRSTSFYWALAAGAVVAAVLARRAGFSRRELTTAAYEGMKSPLIAILILLLVGGLIGVWKASGTVPAMVYYGLGLANPRYLVPAAFLLAVATSMMLGTFLGTLSTIGVAIMGVAQGVGAPLPLVAGALVSGAVFGDRSSPLAGSLNLTAAMTGTELRRNLSALMPTGVIAVLISLGIYILLALFMPPAAAGAHPGLREAIGTHFAMSLWLLLPPALVLALAFLRVPVKWSLGVGVVAGVILAVLVETEAVGTPLLAMVLGYTAHTGDAALDRMLSGGGIWPMWPQVVLLMTAGAFSGIMESTGMMTLVLSRLVQSVKRPVALVWSTMLISASVAAVAANQALAIIVTGRMLQNEYKRMGLSPYLLSRSVADAGTVISPIIPWNIMGVVAAATLGIPVRSFLVYAVLPILLPLVSLSMTIAQERSGRFQTAASGVAMAGAESD